MRFREWQVSALALIVVSCLTTTAQAQVRDSQPPAPKFDQAAAMADLKKFIAGKEEQPAVDLFNNIQQYKAVTAGRFLRIMEFGFTVALGVDCTHCHVPGAWDSDEKPTKQVAREMSACSTRSTTSYLKKIPNLRSTNPAGELHHVPPGSAPARAGASRGLSRPAAMMRADGEELGSGVRALDRSSRRTIVRQPGTRRPPDVVTHDNREPAGR